ncbi:MAG: hypothetical protein DRR19_23560 [Candidatus Parabeggiatoa sp. nov. 1]|nr:MAG: hypothetical protein DRR19_23560 [Gammaproteobacteria bacterium]
MLEKPARILISSGGNEPVRDTVRGGSHSIFAKVFIEGLTGIGENVFTSDELFHSQKMRERVSGQVEQTPEFKMIRSSGHDGGDFVFRRVDRREEERAKKLAKIARLKADKSRYETSNVEDGELVHLEEEASMLEAEVAEARRREEVLELDRLEEEAKKLEAEVAEAKRREEALKLAQEAKKRRLREEVETLRRQKAESAHRQAELERAEAGSGFVKGKVFRDRLRDGSQGPKMVWIPAGSFRMGDLQGGGDSDEKALHQVSVKRFAMGTHEITVGEYLRFVRATGRHAPEWQEAGSKYNIQTGTEDHYKRMGSALTNANHPIVGISWNDATAYAGWLTQQTGQQYRLPTEAQWEYAARAGSTTKYWWGNNIGSNKANCDGCGSQWDDKSTAPVGSFQPNPFGLYDAVGNVWELTCSEYENRYNGKEKRCLSNNRAKSEGRFAVRGGSWDNVARWARTASRSYGARTNRLRGGGFRLARI